MVKTPLQIYGTSSPQPHWQQSTGAKLGVSLVSGVAILAAWTATANALPVRVQGGFYATPAASVPYVGVPTVSPVYRSIQTTVQPGSGFGLSVQIGAPTYYSPDCVDGRPRFRQRRDQVNNSAFINPTVISSPVQNSTLVYPTVVTTPYAPAPYYPAPYYPAPYYPGPYYNIQTVTTVTRPEPTVVIDPQYGVRYTSPPANSPREVVVDPQYGVGYRTVPSGY